ncbi:MAG: hypothetical protein VYE64_08720 [Planctomycetota bacterium]|nr:hypothetical protein [Planctomycetota bacterium]
MNLFFRQFGAIYVAVCIVASGILWSVHIHGAAGCAICQCPDAADECQQNSEELPFLPPHQPEDCVVCQFSGDLGGPLATEITLSEGELTEEIHLTSIAFNLFPTTLAYQGRAPPLACSL